MLDTTELQEALDLVAEHGGTRTAAEQSGLARSTLRHRIRRAKAEGLVAFGSPEDKIELPEFEDDDVDAEVILDHMEERFTQRKKFNESQTWFKIGVPSDDVVGLAVVGDPHIGSNSCNVPLLRRDAKLMAQTPGLHALNIGDTTDNWVGSLMRLYADNDVSKQTERRLARWFLQDSGIPWRVWVMGNHDTMDAGFANYLYSLNASTVAMVDWQAKFRLAFPSREVRVNAAHNHKGTSIYNRLHGQKREALWGEHADIIVAGHHHNWASTQEELDDGRVVTMCRARGYKWLDSHATKNGFRNNEHGATILFVIDPKAKTPLGLVKPFADLEEGCEFLTWKRSQ